jgi:alkylation response protein AidB-like acyl-CoA dehydrogenase
MEFGLTDDQKMMQESVERTLARVCPLERAKAAADALEPVADDVWRALVDLGVAGVLIPEEHGGLGLGLLDAALVAETLGRHVAPVPFAATAIMAPVALRLAGSAAQQARWLPRLASGEAIAAVAITEAVSGARDGAGVVVANGRLSGTALFAIDAGAANVYVVADRAGGLHLVDATAEGITRVPLVSIDRTRSLAELRFDGTPGEPLASGDAGRALVAMRDAGWVALAADTLGAGTRMIEKSVAYALERKQFGRVIGSFQAVKHLCAEMAAELEPCRSLVWYAAHAFDHVPAEASLTAAHAKAHLSEIGRFVARTATEAHGGMGITDLLGLHLWFKRIGLDRQLLGGPEHLRLLAARMQGLAA